MSRYHAFVRPSAKKILATSGTPAFLISNLTNIQYITGLEISAGLLLVTSRGITLFVDSRYTEVAKKNTPRSVTVQPSESIEKAMKNIRKCGCESSQVTLERMRIWKAKFKSTKFVHKKDIIEEFRRQKDPEERKKFRKAQDITHQLMKRIPAALRIGVTEKQLAWKLETWARELGAQSLSFKPIVAFGTHSSRPHHHPTDRPLAKNQIVQIDVGARVDGYCADQSKIFWKGESTGKQRQVLQAVHEALEEAKKAVKAGITNHELDVIARTVLKRYKLEKYFTHALGHGVGLDIHEGVSLSQKAQKQILLKNEIITIEPGVYITGKFGIRLEEEVIVR